MKFDVDSFSFLQDNEYPEGYTTITRAELTGAIEQLMADGFTDEDAPELFKAVETYLYFLDQIKSGVVSELSDDALVIKCDSEGIIEQVYGPAIFKGESGLPVLRVCNDFYALQFEGAQMTCGIAVGEVGVEERDGKDENGVDVKSLVINFDGYFDVLDESFEVPFILESSTGLQKAKVKSWFSKGSLDKVSELLKEPPSGGWTSLNDLAIGEYRVAGIEEQKPHPEYGRSWLIELEGVGPVMSKGKRLESALARNGKIYAKTLAAGKPLTFNVSSKEEVGGGTRVNCGFFSRLPKPEKMVASAQPKAMQPVIEVPAIAASEAQTTIPVSVSEVEF